MGKKNKVDLIGYKGQPVYCSNPKCESVVGYENRGARPELCAWCKRG